MSGRMGAPRGLAVLQWVAIPAADPALAAPKRRHKKRTAPSPFHPEFAEINGWCVAIAATTPVLLF